jgi:hypothetical protein
MTQQAIVISFELSLFSKLSRTAINIYPLIHDSAFSSPSPAERLLSNGLPFDNSFIRRQSARYGNNWHLRQDRRSVEFQCL